MESSKRGCDLGICVLKRWPFQKHIAIVSCDLRTSLGARACVQVLCVQKTRRFAFAFLSPLRIKHTQFGNFAPSHRGNDQQYRNKHNQIRTLSLGMTALWTYASRPVQIQIRVGLELTD